MSNRQMFVSPTQIKDFLRCARYWALTRIYKLPQISKNQVFGIGNILHKTIERYLLADDTGRDESGNVVDIYPEGWLTWKERDGSKFSITEEEGDLIKHHMKSAIKKGLVDRVPGRKVEQSLKRQIVNGVIMCGYIDLLLMNEAEIQDHKTVGNKRYRLSAKGLETDTQMLIYAAEMLLRHIDRGEAMPATVTLTHNQYSKKIEDPWSRRVSTEISADAVIEHWHEMEQVAMEMLELRDLIADNGGSKEYTWDKLPGPEDHDACNAYGGCPFVSICTRRENPVQYSLRVKKTNELNGKTFKKESKVGIFDKFGATPADKEAQKIVAENAEKQGFSLKPQINVEAIKAKAEAKATAPSPGGIFAKPEPIPAEAEEAKVAARTKLIKNTPLNLKALTADKGKKPETTALPTKIAGEFPEVGVDLAAEGTESQQVEPKKKGILNNLVPVPGKTGVPEGMVEVTQTIASAPLDENGVPGKFVMAEPKAESKPKGRKKAGFTLLVNVAAVDAGSRKVISMAKVVAPLEAEIAQTLKAPDFWLADPFKRRDLMPQAVKEMQDSLGTSIIVARNGTADEKSWVAALSLYANMVYYAVS